MTLTPYEMQEEFDPLRELVADFELSCLLLSAGFPQDTRLWWHTTTTTNKGGLPHKFLSAQRAGAICAAPTSEEVGRILPPSFVTLKVGKTYSFVDLMNCDYKLPEGGVAGGGLVIKKIQGCDDTSEVACRVRGAMVLIAKGLFKKIAEHEAEEKKADEPR